jgi:hypothetical protein
LIWSDPSSLGDRLCFRSLSHAALFALLLSRRSQGPSGGKSTVDHADIRGSSEARLHGHDSSGAASD